MTDDGLPFGEDGEWVTLTDSWNLGIEGQLIRHLQNGTDLSKAIGRLRLHTASSFSRN